MTAHLGYIPAAGSVDTYSSECHVGLYDPRGLGLIMAPSQDRQKLAYLAEKFGGMENFLMQHTSFGQKLLRPQKKKYPVRLYVESTSLSKTFRALLESHCICVCYCAIMANWVSVKQC